LNETAKDEMKKKKKKKKGHPSSRRFASKSARPVFQIKVQTDQIKTTNTTFKSKTHSLSNKPNSNEQRSNQHNSNH
jgi:hypothetical protein